jgi:hypothetical protein
MCQFYICLYFAKISFRCVVVNCASFYLSLNIHSSDINSCNNVSVSYQLSYTYKIYWHLFIYLFTRKMCIPYFPMVYKHIGSLFKICFNMCKLTIMVYLLYLQVENVENLTVANQHENIVQPADIPKAIIENVITTIQFHIYMVHNSFSYYQIQMVKKYSYCSHLCCLILVELMWISFVYFIYRAMN